MRAGHVVRAGRFVWVLACAAAAGVMPLVPAAAEKSIFVPLMTYRTGPFAKSGVPIANGMQDYLAMLNERDGGIGGVRIVTEECETGFDTRRGVECYEAFRARKPVIVNPHSTGITLQIIPKASVDHIPVLSIGYGLAASAVGEDFPWVFNPPATSWDGLSVIFRHILEKEGGTDALKGKTIGYIYFENAYGREPIPLLKQLAEAYGFHIQTYPVAAAEMQDQSAQWQAIANDRPSWMIMWGWGAMNPVAIRQAVRINLPMDHFIGSWYAGNESDVRPAGAAAAGYLSVNINRVGADYPAIQDIIRLVVDKGQSQSARERVGENLYNRGVYNGVLVSEAIRNAQRITGRKAVNGDDVRRGLETLRITPARWREIGLPEFGAAITGLSCRDHSGHQPAYIQQWDGAKWIKATGWISPMQDRVVPLIEAGARDYVSKDPSWPKRTEVCDNSS